MKTTNGDTKMTDRELLELAAKAAGVEHPGGDHCVNGPALWDIERKKWWRPLTDDADALRLAVKLNILWDVNIHYTRFLDLGINDNLAATRRAIVRAAAEIGAHALRTEKQND